MFSLRLQKISLGNFGLKNPLDCTCFTNLNLDNIFPSLKILPYSILIPKKLNKFFQTFQGRFNMGIFWLPRI